jgi:hypothetical protein
MDIPAGYIVVIPVRATIIPALIQIARCLAKKKESYESFTYPKGK